ncbi:hypothetical protein [Micromonospora echinofusca]|uniref:Uncharacterized protein n=1 Tax=Micromonospora echinofusca TaxID=47858 RepID=A0ABS3VPN1_MICEH|nr:hypothetical protein [Micromonospora echinofusca]MBO4206428.1 hypothetical protein [Micromonospora echinofusca]
MADAERRRRRLRHGGAESTVRGDGNGSAATTDPYDGPPAPAGRRRPGTPGGEDRDGERGLRGLVGSGASQVAPGAALRARDAARPTEADLAEAERRVTVVRRNWTPREESPRPGR